MLRNPLQANACEVFHVLYWPYQADDAIERIRSEAGQAMMHMAALQGDEGLLTSVAFSERRRLFWLGINLATAFLAALVPDFLKRPSKRSWH